ncbi:hypothetical protein K7G92_000074 [Pasteurella canis]|uniref:hypothetical protein n=1 Tax=Pasteurella canis TaxID=753 RepID=UPI001E5F900A|nr:hypothetical protein [Pasteurella canis]UEA16932.1 hypothetical protein K7G92_000074 [Pasteurella canis]
MSQTDYLQLEQNTQKILKRRVNNVLKTLIRAGSTSGVRPNVQILILQYDNHICRIISMPHDEGWIVKFSPDRLLLKHEEGLIKVIYLTIVHQAKLEPMK